MEQEILPPLPAPVAAPVENWRDGLTHKQAVFVEHYAEYRNATQAYDHAYDARGGSYETRRDAGSVLLKNPAVQRAVAIRQKVTMEAAAVDVAWLARRFLAIGTADARELIGLKVGCCRHCHGEGYGYHWRLREYLEALAEAEALQVQAKAMGGNADLVPFPDPGGGLDFNATRPPNPDCPQCHGEGVERFVPRDTDQLSDQALLLYGGVKVKKDGYEIIMADRTKALELAGRIVGAFTDKVKISGTVAHLHAVADIRNVDQVEAGKIYREFVAGRIAA